MKRYKIINTVGAEYHSDNTEYGEFSYPKAFKKAGLTFVPIKNSNNGRKYEKLDIRFEKDRVSVLIETKNDFASAKIKKATEQLSAYVEYEKALTGNKVIAILANTSDDRIKVYKGNCIK